MEDADDRIFWHGYGNCLEITGEMWKQWEAEAKKEQQMMETFEQWWERDGKFFDPDTDDVPWFDKRKFLAEYAWARARAQSRNYVADEDTMPEKITFANGRVVWLEENKQLGVHHGVYLEVGQLPDET